MNKVLRTFLLSVILVATVCLILITPAARAAQPPADPDNNREPYPDEGRAAPTPGDVSAPLWRVPVNDRL
jgi:hypothetical protein